MRALCGFAVPRRKLRTAAVPGNQELPIGVRRENPKNCPISLETRNLLARYLMAFRAAGRNITRMNAPTRGSGPFRVPSTWNGPLSLSVGWPRKTGGYSILRFSPIMPAGVPVTAAVTAATIYEPRPGAIQYSARSITTRSRASRSSSGPSG